MILSDGDIGSAMAAGELGIEPQLPRSLQPASYEVHLDEVRAAEGVYTVDGEGSFFWLLSPGVFTLGCTVEVVSLGAGLCAQVNGRSSLGRLGLLVHATAGFVDPGFTGQLTLELKNLSSRTIMLHSDMAIAQLVFHRLTTPAQRPYGSPGLGSHYQGQRGTTRSYMES